MRVSKQSNFIAAKREMTVPERAIYDAINRSVDECHKELKALTEGTDWTFSLDLVLRLLEPDGNAPQTAAEVATRGSGLD